MPQSLRNDCRSLILGARVGHLSLGLAFVLAYGWSGGRFRAYPLAQSLFGNASLIASAALVPVVVFRRRREWAGCQRLFWDVIAVAMTLWIIGHVGWVYDQSWLKWHTLFSLCAGIGPLIALLARPHRGARAGFVAPTAMTIGAYWLLAVFLYSVLRPGAEPAARGSRRGAGAPAVLRPVQPPAAARRAWGRPCGSRAAPTGVRPI